MKTVVGLFKNEGDAQSTLGPFARLGLTPNQVGTLSTAGAPGASSLDLGDLGRASANGAMLKLLDEATLRKGSEGVMAALLRIGVSHTDAARCVAGLKRGGVLEAVVVDDSREADVLAIMEGRPRQESRARAQEAWARDKDIVIPVIEEELTIGTRQVDAGGVRVTTHVSARPVEKTVTVREERVTVERRVVDRPIDEYEDAFGERTLEMKASGEEPVVSKRAHVVEEIRVHKDTTERVQRVQDTLRHTDVELADLPGDRSYLQSQRSGPAYEFGQQLRSRLPGRTWDELERQAKAKWDETNPGTWDRYSDVIRAGWETGP
jgi:uncharacterized protein (TIGR02271 family)